MKKPIILLFLLVLSSSFVMAQDSQLEKLRMLSGTWNFTPADFTSTANIPSPPATRVSCEEVTATNGLYCTISAQNDDGEFQVTQSELMVYDQATDKIHMLLFDGPLAYRAEGRFEGNVLRYSDSNMSGIKIIDGTMTFEGSKLTQKIMIAGDNPATLTLVFNKEN